MIKHNELRPDHNVDDVAIIVTGGVIATIAVVVFVVTAILLIPT